jgi:uncharacterized protein YlaI
MPGFIYLCPSTRVRIQASTAEEITTDSSTYLPVTCIMCRQVHYVNPFTGKVLGVDEDVPDKLTRRASG